MKPGSPLDYQPHKLLIPALFSSDWRVGAVRVLVEGEFGAIDLESDSFPFDFTHYYDYEMGDAIFRVLFSIRELVNPADLAAAKIRSNRLESEQSRENGNRTINLDPGLLSLSRVILATTKQSAHRIPIGESIHAEITLLYREGHYRPLEWTYPDFRSERYGRWLEEVRSVYHLQLKEIDADRAWRL